MTGRSCSIASRVLAMTMVLMLTAIQIPALAAQAEPAMLAATNATADHTDAMTALQSSPVMFIENVGQFAGDARFQVRGAGNARIWLAQDAIWMTLLDHVAEETHLLGGPELPDIQAQAQPHVGVNLRLSFVGANPSPQLVPFDRLDTRISYLIGNDPSQWRSGVPVWGGVRYVDLYPGIDLELTSQNGQYTPRLVMHDGAEPNTVHLRVEGAEALSVEDDRLNLTTSVGEVSIPLFQLVAPGGAPLDLGAAEPKITGVEVAAPFSVSSSPSSPTSPQDNPPDLLYGTFLGGWEWDRGLAVALDGVGNMYVATETWSDNMPTTPGAWDRDCGSDGECDPYEYGQKQDAYVARLNAGGSYLDYATFLGGGNMDTPTAIAVDGAGCAYVVGSTGSFDFPTTPGALDRSCGTDGLCNWDGSGYLNLASSDAFVAKLSADGSTLAYATFLGGMEGDYAQGLALDGTGNVYVAGGTNSSDFPTVSGSFDRTYNGGDRDGFAVKINSSGSGLIYSTFLGGGGVDWCSDIKVNAAGNAFLAGSTESPGFPATAGAFDTSHNGNRDAFVAKLNTAGTALIYSTFLGGNGRDNGEDIAVDAAGSAYVAGQTESPDLPATVGAFDRAYGGNQDAFVAKVTANGSGLVYATFLGGNEVEYADGFVVDESGSACILGSTKSSNFPTTPDAFDTYCGTDGDCNFDGTNRQYDVFVTRLNASGTSLAYSTYLGGSDYDGGGGFVMDRLGNAYVTGETYSTGFPTTVGAFDRSHNGQRDAFVAKLVVTKYSISGQVRQANGKPFAGVLVQTNTGLSDVTDANGLYIFDDLLAGTYVLTPSRSGYRFSPTTRSATLPPDTAGQSFAILPNPVSATLTPGEPATLSYYDTQGLLTSVAFPAGAVAETTVMVLTPALATRAPGVAFAGHAFQLEAYQGGNLIPGFTFGAPVTATIHYSDDDVWVVTDEGQLGLSWQSVSGWQDAAETCEPASAYVRDEGNNVLSVPVCHLSLFGLFGPTNQVFLPLALRQFP